MDKYYVKISDLEGSSRIPEGIIGNYKVKKIIINDQKARYSNAFCKNSYSFVNPGSYTVLQKGLGTWAETVMSDTRQEALTNTWFINNCYGDVLIFGLGIGVILPFICNNPNVSKITVVEKWNEVYQLVAPHIKHDKLTIVMGDAFNWVPVPFKRFDCIYFDIWNNICGDNYPEMMILHKRARKFRKQKGLTHSWMIEEYRRLK